MLREKFIDGVLYQLPVVSQRFINVEDEDTAQGLYESLCARERYVAFDCETDGLGRDAKVFGVSFCIGDGEGGRDVGLSYWYRFGTSDACDSTIFSAIRELFKRERICRVIMHHGKFDMGAIRNTFGIKFEGVDKYNDTMILHDVLRRFPSSALKNLATWLFEHNDPWDKIVEQWFVSHKIKKDDRNYEDIPECIMYPYACTDVELTFKTFFALLKLYTSEPAELQSIYLLERQLVPVVSNLQFGGMLIGHHYFIELAHEIEVALTQWQARLLETWGDFNARSPQQLQRLLYGTNKEKGELGLPVLALTETGAPSTASDTLILLRNKHPLVDVLIRYQRCSRALVTIQKLLQKSLYTEAGRTIHTDYRQVLVTGRFSSTEPNLQNLINDDKGDYRGILPGERDISIRRGFIAPDGFLYVKCDYGAFELRILGNSCKDPKFVAMIQAGVDMHSWLAARLYDRELRILDHAEPDFMAQFHNIPQTDTEKEYELDWRYRAVKSKATDELKMYRTIVKTCSFAIVYGSGPRNIAKTFGVSETEASRLRDVYFQSFPVLSTWRKKVQADTERTKLMTTLFGRKRKLQPNEYAGTTAVNHYIQGSAADTLKMAMLDIHLLLDQPYIQSRMCATIHDEIQIYLHHDELELIMAIEAAMEKRRVPEDVMPLGMVAEVSASRDNWANCKELNHAKDLLEQLQAIWKGES